MHVIKLPLLVLLVFTFLVHKLTGQSKTKPPVLVTGSIRPMPDEWIDKDTGHRIKRLSRKGGENFSFYFHNDPFIKAKNGKDDLMVFYSRENGSRQLYSVNLTTLETDQLTQRTGGSGEIVSDPLHMVFYQSKDSVFAVDVYTKETTLMYVFPEDFKATISTINSDGTLLAGSYALPVKDSIYHKNPQKSSYFNLIYEAKIPHTLFTVNLKSGELNKLHEERAWINHVQFSPTDPSLIMYSHEGPWHKVDRIWHYNLKNGKNLLMHDRTMDMEIAGHEFFGPDGKMIWFDLQKPRGETFFLAGLNLETGKEKLYRLDRDEWSIHFNISPDRKLFAGDGGDSTQVAHASDGRWIYLFRPRGDKLESEKLVNMATHNYRPLEPNVHFSPDGKWVIFRSDLDGTTQIYAVEI